MIDDDAPQDAGQEPATGTPSEPPPPDQPRFETETVYKGANESPPSDE